MSRRRIAWVIWPLVALQIALITLRVILEVLSRASPVSSHQSLVNIPVGAASELIFPAVGALIFWRRPEHPIGWLFCLEDIGWSINNFAFAYARYALVTNPGALPAPQLIVWFYGWPGFVSVGLFLFLILLFPNGRLLSPRWRPLAWLVVAWTVVGTLGSEFAPGPVGPVNPTLGIAIDNPAGIAGPVGQLLAQIVVAAFFLAAPLVAAAAVALLLRQRRAQGQERQQLKWLTSAVGLVTILYGLQATLLVYYGSQAAMPLWAYVLFGLSLISDALIPIAAGIAILRYRLYDIDVLINRTLVYGALTAALALAYFASVVLLQQIFRALTGQGQSQLVTVAATLAIAALFTPLRRRIQVAIDRRFYRRTYDAAQVLAAFSVRLRDEVDLNTLTDELLAVVAQTLQPAHVSLWLREPERSS